MSSDESDVASSGEEEVKSKKTATKKKAPTKEKAKKGAAKKEGKKKKAKKEKDPNAPKRALSAFMYYSQANRPLVKKENPDAGFGEIGKILGEQWKALDASSKKEYEKKAAEDKERYDKAKAAYEKKGGASKPAAKKSKKDEDEDEDEDDDESDDE